MTLTGGEPTVLTDHVTHVGVICGRGMLTPEQRADLGRQLQRVGKERPGHLLILHHGCGRDGDEVAHRAARVLGGWRIHGHPASELPEDEVLLRAGAIRGLSRIYESKSAGQRDADIVDISGILIVIRGSGSQPELEAAAKKAEAASRNVIYLSGATNARKTPARRPSAAPKRGPARKRPQTSKPLPALRPPVPKPLPVVAARKDAAWAARQGREDGIAGKPCPKYTKFISTYALLNSDTSLQLWHAYRDQAQRARSDLPPPKPKRKPGRSPSLIRTPTPAAQAKALKESRKKRRPLDSAALFAKLNQQDTLVNMWR